MEYLNLVEDEQVLIKTYNQICTQLKDELELKPIKTTKNIFNIMNAVSKVYLQALGVSDRSIIIIVVRKVIENHNQLIVVQAKANNLQKKVNSFKSKF